MCSTKAESMLKIWPVKSISQPVALATFCSEAVVLLLLFIVVSPIVCGGLVLGLCFAVFRVLSSFVIILLGKRELVAVLLFNSECQVPLSLLDYSLVSWVGLNVIVAFSGHTCLLFNSWYIHPLYLCKPGTIPWSLWSLLANGHKHLWRLC